ncbi:hypothetical protein FF124_13975 [Martelella lutilitoris]|uniref:DUF6455 domain-containing protein n=1 Tax=Martelella lutilitoris TaxID=2583532 RepID=A0A5C4JP85_9HYPH|nr:DUF6455 family protein [Martelella lutilitoris]TNB47276.1 hypothetical protein FF124_13975 [Martelella lutilitoris]
MDVLTDDNRADDRYADWRKAAHFEGEEAALLAFLQRIAEEDIATAEPRDASEMSEMMKALNIDPVEAEFQYRRLYYGMQANCAACRAKERCRKDLACNAADRHFREYCENSEILSEMRADPDMLRFEG